MSAAPKLLVVDAADGSVRDRRARDLPGLLRPGDVVVVNDAATLPASLCGATESGEPVEARLATELGDGRWRAVLFGGGDWRTRTEDRPRPPALARGATIRFDGLTATVDAVDPTAPRLVSLRFAERGDAWWRSLYRAGRPVQYAHADGAYPLWRVQTAYAARPWAVEPPSAGFLLDWDGITALRHRGVAVVAITHAAGLSSTGDEALDARLPFEERYELPAATVRTIVRARDRGGRVVAIGTTVTRALEGAATAAGGSLGPGPGITDVRLAAGSRLRVVDAVLTGVHERETSHFRLLEAFAPGALLERALALAEAAGYRGHELGDGVLVFATADPGVRTR